MWGVISDERAGLSFTIAPGPRQRNHFLVRAPWDSWTIFYCLRFETSLFVASYDSQGYGGGIRPRLHTGGISLNSLHGFLYRLGTDRIENTSSDVLLRRNVYRAVS
jgi:hypothetical protein